MLAETRDPCILRDNKDDNFEHFDSNFYLFLKFKSLSSSCLTSSTMPQDKINVRVQRFHLVRQRVLRNPTFTRPAFGGLGTTAREYCQVSRFLESQELQMCKGSHAERRNHVILNDFGTPKWRWHSRRWTVWLRMDAQAHCKPIKGVSPT